MVAGGTVVIAILGLYVSGVPFVGAMGLASAIVVAVTVMSALTLVPALLGASRGNRVRGRCGASSKDAAAAAAGGRRTDHAHEHNAFARWGRMVSDKPWPWAHRQRGRAAGRWPSRCSQLRLGQLDAGTDPTSETDRRAYDLIAEGFGPGENGPITVVVELPERHPTRQQDAADQHPEDARPHARRRRRQPARDRTRQATPRSSTSSRRPRRRMPRPPTWSTTCATTCCPSVDGDAPTWSAPPPATSTSPSGSRSGCRG